MKIIDADKFLTYLIFSKHIDGLTCGEVKEAIEMCKVDVLDKIRAEIESIDLLAEYTRGDIKRMTLVIIDKYKAESEDRMSKDTTCENCIYANECIMYEPKMKRCKDYKESEVQDADSN